MVNERGRRPSLHYNRRVGSSRDRAIRQAHDALRASIRRGLLGGDNPLVEFQLIRSLGIGRNAVREALQQLADEGLLTRRPAVGTVVARPTIRVSADQILGFEEGSEDAFRERVTVVTLASELVEIGEVLCHTLGMPAGPMMMVEQLISLDAEPICLLAHYVPRDTDLSRMTTEYAPIAGPFQRLFGVPLGQTTTMVEAVLADEWTASVLHVEPGAPLVLREQVMIARDNSVATMSFARYRADRVAFTASAFEPVDRDEA